MTDKLIKAIFADIKIAKRRLLSRGGIDFVTYSGPDHGRDSVYVYNNGPSRVAMQVRTDYHSATAMLSCDQVKGLIAALSECVEAAAKAEKERT